MTLYFIRNKNDHNLVWNNVFGWVHYPVQIFDEEDKKTLNLPIEGEWAEMFVE